MKPLLPLCAVALLAAPAVAAPPTLLATGLKTPAGVAVGPDGTVYASTGNAVVRVGADGKVSTIADRLEGPTGLVAVRDGLIVADKTRVVRVNGRGVVAPLAAAAAFPTATKALRAVAVDPETGTVYVVDAGDGDGATGAVYRVDPKGKVRLVTDATKCPGLKTPTAVVTDGGSFLVVGDAGAGALFRVKIADGTGEKIADGLGAVGGLAWDLNGRLYFADRTAGTLFAIPRPGASPVSVATGLGEVSGVAFDAAGKRLLVARPAAGDVVAVPAVVPGWEVDETTMPVRTEPAFPGLTWTGWEPETDTGKVNQHRPIVLTHAGDGSHRRFVATQQGVIHIVPNDPKPTATTVFLDLRDKVRYDDNTNEEGLLGLAFHPRYKETGEFFVFYTPKAERGVNVVSRFRASKADPNAADPGSEEQVYRFEKRPFWNHDGGTVCFGPDGMLYVTHGDGGAGNDPFGNGQNLGAQFGKILRLDVDHKDPGKNYAVPPGNPFVGRVGARPEIWAYGLRNVWRMAFDRATGDFWAADVGQNLFEEINLIRKGGNYGWNRREGLHPFGDRGSGPTPDLVDPIWEYHHDVGKSITGGTVYRGAKLPELAGHYVYADYVTNKLWALKYDEKAGRVAANRPIPDRGRPVFSFGEDEAGELYLLTGSTNGKGVFVLTK